MINDKNTNNILIIHHFLRISQYFYSSSKLFHIKKKHLISYPPMIICWNEQTWSVRLARAEITVTNAACPSWACSGRYGATNI